MDMITCPWCGTNYAVFQPNCKNCGGRLPFPAETPSSVAGASLPQAPILAPPPPPRPVSDRYLWRLLGVDAWAVVGFVFALLGTIFAFLGIALTVAIVTAFVGIPFAMLGMLFLVSGGALTYWRYQKARTVLQVLREGEAAEGQILTLEQNQSVRINGRHPWVITYQFHFSGREYQGEVTTLNTPGPGLQPGSRAYALYLPSLPEHNALYPHP